MERKESTTANTKERRGLDGLDMTIEQAQSKLEDLRMQHAIAICSKKDIEDFISYIDVVCGMGVSVHKDENGRITRYEVYDKTWE